MKNRAALHLGLSVIVAVMLIVCATAFQTNYSARPADWAEAHSRPILWLVDFTAVYTLILMGALSRTQRYAYRTAEEMHTLRVEHQNQLESVIAQAADLEEKNVAQEERIEELEHEINDSHSLATHAVSTASNLLTEAGYRTLLTQIEAQGRQLEAVNLALQYHRAELSQLRHGLRALSPNGELPSMPTLPLPEPVLTQQTLTEKDAPLSLTAAEDEEMPSSDSEAESEVTPIETPTEDRKPLFDPTVNARSTIVHEIADFQVGVPKDSEDSAVSS